MNETRTWTTLGCNQAANCTQVAPLPDGGMALRSTRRPEAVAEFDAGEWAALVEWVCDGSDPTGLTPGPHADRVSQ